jgi:hypothetical protein
MVFDRCARARGESALRPMTDEPSSSPREAVDPMAPDSVPSVSRLSCVVRLRPDQAVVPDECACCAGAATRAMKEARFDGQGILVPYCAECHRHASRDATRILAIGVSSILLAATLAAGVPLLFQPPSVVVYAILVGLGAVVPAAVASVSTRRASDGHASVGRATFFHPGGALVCRRVSFGERLARASGVIPASARVRELPVSRWAAATLLGIVGLCPFLYRFHFPEARVVNLTDGRLTILVDGRVRGLVSPTSAESPSAGVVLRIPAGSHELRSIDADGRVVDVATVLVRGGEMHLYAPGSTACFWIETTAYGRSRGTTVPDEPLTGEPRFWALPGGIDFWFSPAPLPEADDRSTGGLLRALRQAACERGKE